MTIIRITDRIISEAVNRLNRASGGEAFAWCDGGDGESALAQFDSCTDRDTWLNQI